jgi:hypothetical protein
MGSSGLAHRALPGSRRFAFRRRPLKLPVARTLRRASLLALWLLSLGIAVAEPAQAQTPDGRLLRVNSTSRGDEIYPLVAIDADGRAVVLWTHSRDPGGAVGQILDPQGLPVAGEFACKGRFAGDFGYGVLMQGAAGFLTLCASEDEYYAQRHLPTGAPLGDPVPIYRLQPCTVEGCFDYFVGFAEGSNGEFVAVWERRTVEGVALVARWFDHAGKSLTGEIPLFDGAEPIPGGSVLGVVAGLGRTLTLQWYLHERSPFEVRVQTYSVAGERVGTAFVLPGLESRWAVLAWNRLAGNLVVAWSSPVSEDCCVPEKLYARRLSPEGRPLDPEPVLVSADNWDLYAIACSVRGYCGFFWEGSEGFDTRVMRPDGSLASAVVSVGIPDSFGSQPGHSDYLPRSFAYGGNGALMVVGEDIYTPEDFNTPQRDNIFARRLIASPADEVCQRVGNEVRCDAGRTGSLPELRLLDFGLDRHDELQFGDVDGDGREDPCRVRGGVWRCDADHEGRGTEVTLTFAGAGRGRSLLGDVDGSGRADACTWSEGTLRCDTAHDGGLRELALKYAVRRGELPLFGDLDADGRDELCLWSPGLLRCDVGHDEGRNELRILFGQSGDQLVLGDFDGNGSDDPCLVRGIRLFCDTAHDGGEAEGELLLGTRGAPVLLGNLDGV